MIELVTDLWLMGFALSVTPWDEEVADEAAEGEGGPPRNDCRNALLKVGGRGVALCTGKAEGVTTGVNAEGFVASASAAGLSYTEKVSGRPFGAGELMRVKPLLV